MIAHLGVPYLNVVITVVVEIEHPVDLGVTTDLEILDVFNALRDGLSRVLFHLDVVELPETRKHDQSVRNVSIV